MKSLQNIELFMVMSLVFCAGNAVGMDANIAEQALLHAARFGNLENVQAAIAAGADVNSTIDMGYTLLRYAIIEGNLDIVQALIQAGADVNHRDYYGSTVLHSAVSNGRLDIVQALIIAGADVNAARYDNGKTALIFGILEDSLDIVQALIQAGADVNIGDNRGDTPLRYAAYGRSLDMVHLIINADGFDPDQLQSIIDNLAAKENKKPVEQEILDILQERQTFNPMGLK